LPAIAVHAAANTSIATRFMICLLDSLFASGNVRLASFKALMSSYVSHGFES
jgi:hypothetical protein